MRSQVRFPLFFFFLGRNSLILRDSKVDSAVNWDNGRMELWNVVTMAGSLALKGVCMRIPSLPKDKIPSTSKAHGDPAMRGREWCGSGRGTPRNAPSALASPRRPQSSGRLDGGGWILLLTFNFPTLKSSRISWTRLVRPFPC